MPIPSSDPSHAPRPADRLPPTLLSLPKWGLVTIGGPERDRYLQGQVTCDVATLHPQCYLLGAHCNAQGKMWSCFYLFALDNERLALFQRRSVCTAQAEALKKYALFSKVEITIDQERVLLGAVGTGIDTLLQPFFERLPHADAPCQSMHGEVVLYFSQPVERFLLVLSPQKAVQLIAQLRQQGVFYHSTDQQWVALDISAGFPLLDQPHAIQWLPQAVNLPRLSGVSFTKGCYLGQEAIARAQYRGVNKRALYWLSGRSNQLPQVGEPLSIPRGEKWRPGGSVLAAVYLEDGTLWVQAILQDPLNPALGLRVLGDPESLLYSQPLPYAHTPCYSV